MKNDNTDEKRLLIEIEMPDREFESKANLFNYRAWNLTRHGLNLFTLIRFASVNADERLKTPADIQDFMFAIETAAEIGRAVILHSWEDSDKVLKIAEIKLDEVNDGREKYFLEQLENLSEKVREIVLEEIEKEKKESSDYPN